MKPMIKLILTLLLVMPSTVFANAKSHCPSYNLYQDSPYLNELPIQHQGFTGMCYALTSSDFINYQLKKRDSPLQTSPFWLGYVHKKKVGKKHWNPDSLSFSLFSWEYNDALNSPHCPRETVEERLGEMSEYIGLSPYNIIEVYELIWDYFKLSSHRPKAIIPQELETYIKKTFKNKFKVTSSQIYQLAFNYLPLTNYKKLLDFYREQFFQNCMDSSASLSEKKLLPLKIFSTMRIPRSPKKQEAKLLDTMNRSKKSPITIGYCSRVLRTPKSRKKIHLSGFPLLASKNCGAHYSLLVGGRQNGESCEALVRNSYGEKHWPRASHECFCEHRETQKQFSCQKKSFNPNNEKILGCWIKTQDLAAHTFELNYLKD